MICSDALAIAMIAAVVHFGWRIVSHYKTLTVHKSISIRLYVIDVATIAAGLHNKWDTVTHVKTLTGI